MSTSAEDRADRWRHLAQIGMHGWCIPTAYGGSGLGALDTARLVEALGRGCVDTGLVFGASAQLFSCTIPILAFGDQALRDRWLPDICAGKLTVGNAMTETGSGSDVSRLSVTAHPVDGGWLLRGEKSFVSNGPIADLFVTYATTDARAGHLGLTAFAVERGAAGVTVGQSWDKMGLAGCPAGRLTLDDCFVPERQVIGSPGQGSTVFQHAMAWERTCLFAGYLGLADRIVDQAIAHVRQRRQFGQPLSRFQAVSHRIADMVLRVDSARLLLYRACCEMDEDRPSPLSVAMAKLAVSEHVLATALDCVRLFGARGYLRDDGIEAALRDTVPSVIFSGTSDIQREIMARELQL